MRTAIASLLAAVLLPLAVLGGGAVLAAGGAAATGNQAGVGAAVLVESMAWSPVLADAVAKAVAGAEAYVPGCKVRMALVAAVVEIEAGGGRGRTISAPGDTDPKVIGPALDGSLPGTAVIADTDGGRWDADPTWDHAVGIAQFLPGTWARGGIDASGDGIADPHNVYDAVASQVAKLCRDGFPMATPDDERKALFAYNAATWYVDRVMAKAVEIQALLDAAGPAVDGGTTVDRPGGGTLELATVGGITVSRSIAPQVEQLLRAAAADGIVLGGSGYRSTQRQVELRQTNGCPDLYTAPAESCRIPTAIPGTSMHEIGEAIDFTHGGSTISRDSPAFSWLSARAGRFGFTNLPSEPWHWSVNGRFRLFRGWIQRTGI